MTDITEFLTKHPLDRRTGQFAKDELEAYKDKLPQELYEFLEQEQKSVYGNGFFRTVSPKDFHDVLNNWGLDGKNCHAFLRSSFGCVEFFSKDKYYRFNPHLGIANANCPNDLDFLLNAVLTNTTNLEIGFCYDLHFKHHAALPELRDDEMYALVPAVPLGGSKETSRIEVVKMDVQLDILAQLYDHRTSE
jgi:hypothetical protein